MPDITKSRVAQGLGILAAVLGNLGSELVAERLAEGSPEVAASGGGWGGTDSPDAPGSRGVRLCPHERAGRASKVSSQSK
jgi:hypothetical protein